MKLTEENHKKEDKNTHKKGKLINRISNWFPLDK